MYGTVTNPALRVLGAPREYIQGPGAMRELPQLAARHGKGHLAAVIDGFLYDRMAPQLATLFQARGQTVTCLRFAGEATPAEGARLTAAAAGADVVVGIGGGKAIDIGKYTGLHAGLPVFSMPTIASNDAPTSRLIVLYNEDHAVVGTEFMPANPDVVLVDTDIIAAAPPRLLRAGIGDALTKFYEARAARAGSGKNSFSASPPYLGLRLGEICLEVVHRLAVPVLADLERGQRHAGFEELVETLILLSGLAFESGGLSVAHSMVRGMTRVPALSDWLHGEQVAYSTLVQIMLEGDAQDLARAIAFNRRLGLPVALRDMGVARDAVAEAATVIGTFTMTAPYIGNFPRALTAEAIRDAVLAVEAQSQERA